MKCESRVKIPEGNRKHSEYKTAKDMQEQALRRAHFGSGLNVSQVAEPVEEVVDRPTHRAYESIAPQEPEKPEPVRRSVC